MIYINMSELLLPDDLKQKLESASDELVGLLEDERNAFMEKKADLWQAVKPYLAQVVGKGESDYKCWYCETKDLRFDYHVDHFRPKNRVKNRNRPSEPGYWWLAFKYMNYRLSCAYCNSPHRGDDRETRGKWDQFPLQDGCPRATGPEDNLDEEIPLLVDPTNAGDPGLLSFGDDGRAYPCYSLGFAHQKAVTSIDVLNLNDVRIVEARKRLRLACVQLIDRGNLEFALYMGNGSAVAKKAFDSICQQIVEMVSRTSEFSAMARYCFQGTGQKWVLALLQAA